MLLSDEKQKKRLNSKVKALKVDARAKRKRADRRDKWLYGVMIAFYVGLIVLSFAINNPSDAIWVMATLIWVLLALMLNLQINFQRYIIDMQFGLREIEAEEIDLTLKEAETKSKAKAAQKTK